MIGAMSPRLLVLAIAPVFAAATAHAQAPGEMEPTAPPPGPPSAPAVSSIMDNRWSVGLGFGGLSVAPDDNPDAKLDFAVGELALRYRFTPHVEIEASLAGGRQQLQNGDEGDLAISTGTLALRYRFNPESAWNAWVMAGLGGTTIAQHDATKEQRDAAGRGHGLIGLGIERRFERFAIQAEARAIKVGDASQDQTPPVKTDVMGGLSTSIGAAGPQGGAQLTVGVSYYF